jgi:RNA polymerase sigma factor FliA
MTKLTLERDHAGEWGDRSTDLTGDAGAAEPGDICPGDAPPAGERDQLVLHYEPLVRQVAGRVGTRLPPHVDHADLIQAGVFGLIDAIDRFEPATGVRFEVYAAQRIRGAILDELRAQDWVPRTVRVRARELDKAREAVEAKLQRRATAAELAAELGVGPAEVHAILDRIRVISLEALDDWSRVRGVPADALAEHGSDPFAIVENRENRELLRRALARLPERDQRILRLYYTENLTLARIGRELGVTESRVSQLRSRAVVRLRQEYARLDGINLPVD